MAASSAAFVQLIVLALGAHSSAAGAATGLLINPSELEERFHVQVQGYAGKSPLNPEMPEIRKALEPMWLEAAKNEHDRLGNDAVMELMDKFFVQRHDWAIEGLRGIASSEPSAAGLSREQVPAFLLNLFEEIFGKEGMMLHELALFAATLEQTIQEDGDRELKAWLEKAEEEVLQLPSTLEACTSSPLALAVLALVAVAGVDAARRFAGMKVKTEKVQ